MNPDTRHPTEDDITHTRGTRKDDSILVNKRGHDVIQPDDGFISVDDIFGGPNKTDINVIKGEDNG